MGNRKEERRKERQQIYNSTRWKKLRNLYYQEHPLCEQCLKEGRITPSHDIHHRLSPFVRGLSPEERIRRAYDWDNLMALCVDCHVKEHQKESISALLKKYSK